MERAMDVAYKSLPYTELSREVGRNRIATIPDVVQLGISESRLKDQFKVNRSNIRKQAEQLFTPAN